MFLYDSEDLKEFEFSRGNKYFLKDLEKQSISHSTKPDDILNVFSDKSRFTGPFSLIVITIFEMYSCLILDIDELNEWIYHLYEKGLVLAETNDFKIAMENNYSVSALENKFQITPQGWSYLESKNNMLNKNKVFIAMSFGIAEREDIEKAIRQSCEANSFVASTVDKEHYQGGISDKIISLINQAAFIICDFTENKHGVYYEAGYAEGLGKTVIHTVKKDEVGSLHFDTRHLNHITWDNPLDLEEKLKNRIGSLFNKV